jgi:mono/diheme cytochrome c family protein
MSDASICIQCNQGDCECLQAAHLEESRGEICMKNVLLFWLLWVLCPGAYAQYLGYSFKADPHKGEQLYKAACVSCHGSGGQGAPQTISAFERPNTFPDFTRCDQTTPEVNSAYKAVIVHGGPQRGFSQIMPAFGQALGSEEIDDLVAYLRTFCRKKNWPRGELNLPRALFTEKAYPEDEEVISTAFNVKGKPGNESHIIHEQRFGMNNQIEVDVPIQFENQNHVWYGGVGDATLAVKRVMYSNLNAGSILSLQGGFLIPSGNRSRGFGSGTTSFETFAAFDQLFRTNTFVQTQFGAELPFRTSVAPQSLFFNTAIGQSLAGDHYLGRLWSPMFEFTMNRDLTTGGRTDWDVVPQIQVTISRRQHIRGDLGLRIPVADTTGRQKQVVFYLLWDWQDGKLTEGW